jgi:hypothetical protein
VRYFRTDSCDTNLRCGEKIAQAPGLVFLCLNETILAFEVARIIQSGGKQFVFLGIAFETRCFCVEGLIEARADVVGFVVEVQGGKVLFCISGVCGSKLLWVFGDTTDSYNFQPDSTWSFRKFVCVGKGVTPGGYNGFFLDAAEPV